MPQMNGQMDRWSWWWQVLDLEGQEDSHRKIIIKKAVAILRNQPMQMEYRKDKDSKSNQNNEENTTKS